MRGPTDDGLVADEPSIQCRKTVKQIADRSRTTASIAINGVADGAEGRPGGVARSVAMKLTRRATEAIVRHYAISSRTARAPETSERHDDADHDG
jgi:CTP:molybdopterin cytidylyltransferase MocA